jgi:sugar lactone lactonase YvrE
MRRETRIKLLALAMLFCGAFPSLGQSNPFTFTTLRVSDGSDSVFMRPSGICLDAAGSVYVADAASQVIVRMNKPAAPGQDWTVTVLAGKYTSRGFTDGVGSAARFDQPNTMVMDSNSVLYIADASYNTIRKITPVAADGTTNWTTATIAGKVGTAGSTDGVGTNARFKSPFGLALDNAGTLYVADSGNHTIRMITPDGQSSTLVGSPGLPGSNDGVGDAARLNYPNGLVVDRSGVIYVCDYANRTIRQISPVANGSTTNWQATTIAGLAGARGTDDGLGVGARFDTPSYLALGSTGELYVSDQLNNTIRKLTPPNQSSSNLWTVTTIGGLASVAGKLDGTGTAARFNSPQGLTLDSQGNLYVADMINMRIMVGKTGVPRLTRLEAAVGHGTNLGLTLYGVSAGNRVILENSTDLSSWQGVQTNLTAGSSFSVTPSTLTTPGSHFFRTRVE